MNHYASVKPGGQITAVAECDSPPQGDWTLLTSWPGWAARPAPGLAPFLLPDGTFEWRDPRTLEEARAAKWAAIKVARDAAEYASTFEALGDTFDSSPVRIGGASTGAQGALAAGVPFAVTWTLADNRSRVLDALQMFQVGMAQLGHIDGLHQQARQLRAALDAATTLAEVDAVEWPA